MQEPNFFQSKIALAKAFPGRKLPMTKLQQLYREIYKSAPKRHVLKLIREENKIGDFQGEGSIYNHKDMDALIDKYMDFDREMQYYAEALNNAESPTSPTRDQKARASKNSIAPFIPPSLDQNFTLTKFNLQKVKESERLLPNTPSQSIHFSTNRPEKASSLPVSPKARVFKSKWPKEIQALKDSIEKHEAIKKSTRRLETNPTQRTGDSSPVKENLAELNNHLKSYLHRLGLEHHKTVMEEAKEISKFSPKKPENITGSSFFSRDEKLIRIETNPDGKKLERDLSIFSKGRRPEHLETMPGEQSPERHLSLFSKEKRHKRFSSIPNLQIPSLNLQEKVQGERSPSPQENISFSSCSQFSPTLKFKSASQVMSPLLQHSPLLSKNPSPVGTSTNFSLPKIRKSQKAVSLSLSQPKNKKKLNFASRNEMEEIFKNCARAQDNIGAIVSVCNKRNLILVKDKKLEKDNKNVIHKLSKMDIKLQRVMQVNFLPQEFIFDDQL